MVILYDVTRHDSFEHISSWIEEGWVNNRKNAIPFVIGGNKIDLRNESSITEEEGRTAVERISKVTKKELGFPVPYIEVSAKTGEGVTALFMELRLIYLDWLRGKGYSI